MDKTISHEALSKAVAFYPTLRAFSNVLGVRYQVVQQWFVNGVPAEYCPQIERLTGGVVRCEELNEKVDWAYIRAATQAGGAEHMSQAEESNAELRREVDLSYRQPADPKKVSL